MKMVYDSADILQVILEDAKRHYKGIEKGELEARFKEPLWEGDDEGVEVRFVEKEGAFNEPKS